MFFLWHKYVCRSLSEKKCKLILAFCLSPRVCSSYIIVLRCFSVRQCVCRTYCVRRGKRASTWMKYYSELGLLAFSFLTENPLHSTLLLDRKKVRELSESFIFGVHSIRLGRVEFHWRHVRIRTKVIETLGMGGLNNHLGFHLLNYLWCLPEIGSGRKAK